jgi:hypothetical protein
MLPFPGHARAPTCSPTPVRLQRIALGGARRLLPRRGRRPLGLRVRHGGVRPRTNTWPPTADAQAATSLDIIERALREAGATLLDVVRVRVYVPDRADVEAVSAVIKDRLGAARAANTTVCAPLAVENARVEIEVTAFKPA